MKYTIRGTDRACGAIGAHERFVIEIDAPSGPDARSAAHAQRYADGREHVLILGVTVS